MVVDKGSRGQSTPPTTFPRNAINKYHTAKRSQDVSYLITHEYILAVIGSIFITLSRGKSVPVDVIYAKPESR